MAKIEISVDTEKKTGSVKVDGKTVKDVSSVWLSLDEFFNVDIAQREVIDDNTVKITRIVAEISRLTEKTIPSKEYAGMFEYEQDKKDYTSLDLSKILIPRLVDSNQR